MNDTSVNEAKPHKPEAAASVRHNNYHCSLEAQFKLTIKPNISQMLFQSQQSACIQFKMIMVLTFKT
jgi:hypothetical protein